MASGLWRTGSRLLLLVADVILFAILHTAMAIAAIIVITLAIAYGTVFMGLALYIGAPQVLSIIFGSVMGLLFWPLVILAQKVVKAIIDDPEEE